MKGGIYSDEKCPLCGGNYKHFEPKGLWCPDHPDCRPSSFVVRWGKGLTRRFDAYDSKHGGAHRFLTGLRFKSDEKSLDLRDYRKDMPLGFANLVAEYIKRKKKEGKVRRPDIIQNELNYGVRAWGNMNIKHIQFPELEDLLLYDLVDEKLAGKTRFNIRGGLHAFWTWASKRYGIEIPEFPVVEYELGWRAVVDKPTQQAIIEEVKGISAHVSPKIWLGIKWLSTYYEIRPYELLQITEGDFNYRDGSLLVRYTKTKTRRTIFVTEEDMALARSFGPAMPHVRFFRHGEGIKGVAAGRPFGRHIWYRWWKRACENLGIEGVDLYGGTRHSTARYLRKFYSREDIREGAWGTNKAADRYLGPVEADRKREMYRVAQNGPGEVRQIKGLME